jgi:hypothetical protein
MLDWFKAKRVDHYHRLARQLSEGPPILEAAWASMDAPQSVGPRDPLADKVAQRLAPLLGTTEPGHADMMARAEQHALAVLAAYIRLPRPSASNVHKLRMLVGIVSRAGKDKQESTRVYYNNDSGPTEKR